MKQQQFITHHGKLWDDIESLLKHLQSPKKNTLPDSISVYQFPQLYRQVCQHYAIARQRHYSPHLIDRLHRLVIASHNRFYAVNTAWLKKSIDLILFKFPSILRQHAAIFWFACALFYLPGLLMGVLSYFNDELIYSVMSDHQVSNMEAMYDPENRIMGRQSDRQADTDFQMFGYYILNNISIGFRTFASGLLLGLGTVFNLLYNGIVIGSVAGYLSQLGFTQTFWPFVSGHSAFELTAIVISGTAGLLLAMAIFAPARLTRSQALVEAGKKSVVLVSGAAVMLLVAAFIEAYWSSSSAVPAEIKYTVAAAMWLFVIWFLAFSKRR